MCAVRRTPGDPQRLEPRASTMDRSIFVVMFEYVWLFVIPWQTQRLKPTKEFPKQITCAAITGSIRHGHSSPVFQGPIAQHRGPLLLKQERPQLFSCRHSSPERHSVHEDHIKTCVTSSGFFVCANATLKLMS